MKSLGIDRPTLDDPLYSQRNPHQTFLLLFSLYAANPLVVGSGSGVLDRELDQPMLLVWGTCMFAGAALGLIGQYWRGHTWTGLLLERYGLFLVGLAALIYAVVLAWTTDLSTVRYVVCVNLAYAGSCFWRVGQIHARLRYIRRLVAEVNARHER